ncbi:MAG: hypothetical protein ACR2MF_01805 [Chthoniobacterales bacterium]
MKSDESADLPRPFRAPTGGVRLMIATVVVLALVALYANVQRARRGKIETVTVTSLASPSPSATRAR